MIELYETEKNLSLPNVCVPASHSQTGSQLFQSRSRAVLGFYSCAVNISASLVQNGQSDNIDCCGLRLKIYCTIEATEISETLTSENDPQS